MLLLTFLFLWCVLICIEFFIIFLATNDFIMHGKKSMELAFATVKIHTTLFILSTLYAIYIRLLLLEKVVVISLVSYVD